MRRSVVHYRSTYSSKAHDWRVRRTRKSERGGEAAVEKRLARPERARRGEDEKESRREGREKRRRRNKGDGRRQSERDDSDRRARACAYEAVDA